MNGCLETVPLVKLVNSRLMSVVLVHAAVCSSCRGLSVFVQVIYQWTEVGSCGKIDKVCPLQ